MRVRTEFGFICFLAFAAVSPHTLFPQRNAGPVVPSQFYSEPKTFTRVIEGSEEEYSIQMEGNLDFENSSTRTHNDWVVSFQPNVSLTLENIGDTTIKNPRIVVNDRGNWHALDDLLTEILKGATTDQEKLYAIWQFVTRRLPHDNKVFRNDLHEAHDPVKMFNIYGKGLCGDLSTVQATIWHHAGFDSETTGQPPVLRNLHGHTSTEVFINNDYQLLDIDHWTFFLDLENRLPVNGQAIVRDHYLAKREHSHGPEFRNWNSLPATQFGEDDTRTVPEFTSGHRMDWRLRPGEKVVHSWKNIGKTVSDLPSDHPRSRWNSGFYGNSQIVYEPRMRGDQLERGADEIFDIVSATADGSVRAGGSKNAYLIYRVESPYVIAGGNIAAQFQILNPADRISVSLSLDRSSWQEIWNSEDYHWLNGPSNRMAMDQPIDHFLETFESLPKYRYWVRINLASAGSEHGANVSLLAFTTDILNFPLSLPSLRLGANRVRYTDDTDQPHVIRVSHVWKECDSIQAPQSPAVLYPANEMEIRDSIVEFRWEPVKQCSRYHLQVSRYPDMRYIYRPSLDMIIKGTSFHNPFTGIFSTGENYYWRLRSRNNLGVWSEWSAVCTFRWKGPHVPTNLKLRKKGESFELTWEPNRQGERPVAYEVYGSDEKGFTTSKEPYEVWVLGHQPANYLGRTSQTEMIVASPDADSPNMNRAYYRVMAVDSFGTSSGCSDYVEMPRPYVISRPPNRSQVGEEYYYAMQTIRSIGDLHKRKTDSSVTDFYIYAEREAYRYTLLEGPKWLKLERGEGILSGKPSSSDVGKHLIQVQIDTYYPDEIPPWVKGDSDHFSKRDERFRRQAIHGFTIEVF